MLVSIEERKAIIAEIFEKFDYAAAVRTKVTPSELLDFYRGIFAQKPDIIVCMSRKSWCVFRLFLPIIKEEGLDVGKTIVTHDRMIHPVLAEMDPAERAKLKIFVIDDTFQTGRAIDDCLRRLTSVYYVDKNNITVAVFAMAIDAYGFNRRRIDAENKHYTVYKSSSRPGIKSFQVNWGGSDLPYTKEEVSLLSNIFVETLHACSEPYVGYIPAFRIPLEIVQERLGAYRGKEVEIEGTPPIRVPGYLEQDDLKTPYNNSQYIGFSNITSLQMRQNDVESFFFTLSTSDSELPFIPTKDALHIAALRFYLNRKTGQTLVVPYISLNDCYADAKIIEMFPKKLQPLMNGITSPVKKWNYREEHLCAYRLLRYASGYLWGKYIIKQWFDIDVTKKDLASNGGICSETFFDWLNNPSAEQDLAKIWPFFAPEKGNVVKEKKIPQQNGEKDLEAIIRRNLSYDDPKNFYDAIYKTLLIASSPKDYYVAVSMIFRRILDREYEMLNEYAKKNEKKLSLPPPFHGFPLHAFFQVLLKMYPKLEERKIVLTTVMLMLCDMGIAVTQLQQRKQHIGIISVLLLKRRGVIGTDLCSGEQSCHALAPIAPEYAHFLSDFPKLVGKLPKEQRREKFEIAKTAIKEYFEDDKNKDKNFMSLNEWMAPLDDIKNIVIDHPERDYYAYSVLPKCFFFDNSEHFFLELREKLTT